MTKLAHQSLCIAAVISLVALVFRAPRAEKEDTAMTKEALSVTFESAIRNLVINWDPTDPQTADERLKSLSTFMYETYDASAWRLGGLIQTASGSGLGFGSPETKRSG